MTVLSTFIKILIAIAFSMASLVAPNQVADITAAHSPLKPEECLLNFATVSDVHVTDGIENLLSQFMFAATMPDIEKGDYDALVFTGDITDHGYLSQWESFKDMMKPYDPADRIILAMGNHDTRTRDDNNGARTAKGLFMEYSLKITGKLPKSDYYSAKVNDYSFIVLSSEEDSTDAFISNKQLKWLKAEMKKASKSGKPIFVISHWPINMTHGLPASWGDEDYDNMTGGFGKQSKKVQNILNQYDNVFLIGGHIHLGFSKVEEDGYGSIEKVGNIYSVNLPAFHGVNENRKFNPGAGYSVEVYEDEVVFRARNYFTELWQPEYNYTIKLK